MRTCSILFPAILCAVAPAVAWSQDCPLSLVDVAVEAGIRFRHDRGASGSYHLPETFGSGLAWLDYDGDGRLDLYVVQSGPFPPHGGPEAGNRLYRNLGDGKFADVTSESSAGDRGYGQGVAAADVDGDGDTDLYLCNFGRDTLLLNLGDGRFEDATTRAGLDFGGWSSSAAFADADADGDLDLYVARYVEYDPAEEVYCGDAQTGERAYCNPELFRGVKDGFYRNRGDGTFEDVTAVAGITEPPSRGLGVVFQDLDGDHLPDVYVANDLAINHLYRNRGDGSFESRALVSGAGLNRDGEVESGMGIAAADVDGDGDPELMVTHFDVETNTLYRNLSGMVFEDVSAASGFGLPSFNLLGFGIAAADLDLDGDLDIYVTNGHIQDHPKRQGVDHAQPDLVLLGDGRGQFRPAPCPPATDPPAVGRGLAQADFDDDGDVDLAISTSGGDVQLLRNDASAASWVGLHLLGELPNRGAIGAAVTLVTSRGARHRWVAQGGSYQSSGDLRLQFALGDGERAQRLEIEWPAGEKLVLENPSPGRYLQVREGASETPGRSDRRRSGFGAVAALTAVLVVLAGIALVSRWRRRRRLDG